MRETVAQTLASLLIHMPRRAILRVHQILLDMVRQQFTEKANQPYIWQVRHAGMLGLKYEVAVRHDLITRDTQSKPSSQGVKLEGIDEEVHTPDNVGDPQEIMRSIVSSAILG